MKPIQHDGHIVCIFDGDEDLTWVHQTQDQTEKNKLIFVALEGTDDKYLHPDRFIIKNKEASLTNHFMWEGLLSLGEHDIRMWSMIDNFIATHYKQHIIENYKFVDDEPFYDYSGGRDK